MDKVNKWLSLTANIGVIVGIAFLAVELNQNNDLMASQDRYNRLTSAQQGRLLLVQDPKLREIVVKSRGGDLSQEESIAFQSMWDLNFTGWEWSFLELDYDELPIERFRVNMHRNPLTVSTWDALKKEYDEEFVRFIEDQVIAR